ncbi:HNH endonuclease [Micromonospora sp. FIMYZ51]|uniref:HNH endonuclease n=1 Tax=Micromonospora sp. FIMYZ51 TaxID=3051832 RepID=UPI003221CF5D
MACGAVIIISRKVHPDTFRRTRLAVHLRDDFKCQHCGWQPPVPSDYDGRYALSVVTYDADQGKYGCRLLELDHIHPYARGGKFQIGNLQTLCNYCNCSKGDRV